MKSICALLLSLLAVTVFAAEPGTPAAAAKPAADKPVADKPVQVLLQTSVGDITLELDAKAAPKTVANFLQYVDEGFYNNTLFHRVIPDFMIQGGGMQVGMVEKPTRAPITNESANGLANQRGTIAMARTQDPDSATAQFFINLVDNSYLNGNSLKPGYAVFGKVLRGMEVIDRIARVPTRQQGIHGDVPVQDVLITRAKRLP